MEMVDGEWVSTVVAASAADDAMVHGVCVFFFPFRFFVYSFLSEFLGRFGFWVDIIKMREGSKLKQQGCYFILFYFIFF